jgi:ubiquinone/menaquinone biosynthesis C-methylase UbiE
MVHFLSQFFNNSQDFVSMEIANIAAYEQADLVQKFYRDRSLHKPEQTILDSLRAGLKNMRMLDIGVGAGRTTFHFAELVKEYVGIDAASHMIAACKERFANAGQNISFEVCNVRNMQIFEDNYFDFILFSYNGLDLLNHAGRLEALREIRRVCKLGGLFYFSSHNLYSIKRALTVKWSAILEKPRAILYLLKLPIIRLLNPSPEKLEKMDYAIIKDGGHRFRIITYYIKPEKQIEQLTELGFANIKIFSLEDGKEVDINSNLSSVKDFWLHYSCNK